MLGLITSNLVAFAVVVGITAAVFALVLIWARPRSQPAFWSVVSAVIIAGSAVGLTAALRGTPAETISAVAPAAPAGPTASPTPSGTPAQTNCRPNGTDLQLAAKNISFDAACLAAPAHSALKVAFDNQDSGISHSFHILTTSPITDPKAAKTLFQGKVITGPAKVTYRVGSLRPGTYYFQCDVHPAQMNGTFIVG